MADKTTTLKTKTNDNVYPNVIGDNRKNAFVDSSTITHHFYDKTHKVGFQINNETNIKIQNSLQKPAGLTKTKLVGVGTNGQENIEIGDNLTLANGKLSATGGGGSGGEDFDTIVLNDDGTTYTGTISGTKPVLIRAGDGLLLGITDIEYNTVSINSLFSLDSVYSFTQMILSDGVVNITTGNIQGLIYSHFITLTSNTLGNINFNYSTTKEQKFTIETFTRYFSGKRVTCSGFINYSGTRKIAQYISGENDKLRVFFYDLSDGSTDGIIIDNTFSITDRPTPVY